MQRITIPLYYCKSRVPLVVFRLENDKPYVGVIDTGSEITMFDEKLKDEGMNVTDMDLETSFIGVNGEGERRSALPVDDDIRFRTKEGDMVSVKTDGILFDLTGLTEVFQRKVDKDFTISAIIGSDFLKTRNAKIDYRSKTLTIDENE